MKVPEHRRSVVTRLAPSERVYVYEPNWRPVIDEDLAFVEISVDGHAGLPDIRPDLPGELFKASRFIGEQAAQEIDDHWNGLNRRTRLPAIRRISQPVEHRGDGNGPRWIATPPESSPQVYPGQSRHDHHPELPVQSQTVRNR